MRFTLSTRRKKRFVRIIFVSTTFYSARRRSSPLHSRSHPNWRNFAYFLSIRLPRVSSPEFPISSHKLNEGRARMEMSLLTLRNFSYIAASSGSLPDTIGCRHFHRNNVDLSGLVRNFPRVSSGLRVGANQGIQNC